MSGADVPPDARPPAAPADAPGDWRVPKLRIDRDGDWYDDGVQITHPGILNNLRGNLRRDEHGHFIQTRVRIPVEVDDVPWAVVRVERRGESLHGFLNDGTEEAIDPTTLRIGPDQVPRCAVKDKRFEARLSRAAAFQLLALVETTAEGEALRLGDTTWPLTSSGAPEWPPIPPTFGGRRGTRRPPR